MSRSRRKSAPWHRVPDQWKQLPATGGPVVIRWPRVPSAASRLFPSPMVYQQRAYCVEQRKDGAKLWHSMAQLRPLDDCPLCGLDVVRITWPVGPRHPEAQWLIRLSAHGGPSTAAHTAACAIVPMGHDDENVPRCLIAVLLLDDDQGLLFRPLVQLVLGYYGGEPDDSDVDPICLHQHGGADSGDPVDDELQRRSAWTKQDASSAATDCCYRHDRRRRRNEAGKM